MESISILIYPRKTKQNKQGLSPVNIRVTINGQRIDMTMLFRIPPLRLFIFLLIVLACEQKKRALVIPIDLTTPFQSCFWGKGVKYLLTENFNGGYDTTKLDRSGNMIYIHEYGRSEWNGYDSVHHLVRALIKTDVSDNVIINYSIQGDSLIQTWTRLGGSRWELSHEDSIPQSSWRVVSRFDQQGHIVSKKFDSELSVDYTYNEKGLLVSDKSQQNEASILYDSADHLTMMMVRLQEGSKNVTHYFNRVSGLPDSSRVNAGDHFYTTRYRYIMY